MATPLDIMLSTERNPWAADSGGGQVVVHNQAVELCRRGHRVRVVYTFREHESPPDGVDVPYEIVRAPWSDRFVTRAFAMKVAAARSLEARSADLVHLHCECSIGTYVAARSHGIPMVFTCHHPEPLDANRLPRFRPRAVYRTLRFRGMRKLTRRADAIVVVSRWAAEVFVELGYFRSGEGADGERIHLVPNGVDELFLQERRAGIVEVPRLISVGRLAPQKRFDLLMEACGQLREAGVPFRMRIVGEGPSRGDLARRIRSLELDGAVELVGHRSQREIAAELADADVFVLTSASETFGLAVFEAMGVGLPVVVPDIPGLGEFVEPGKNAVVYPAGNVQALVDAVRGLLRDREHADRLGRSGREYVRRDLTWRASTDRLCSVYREVLEGP